MIRRVLLGISGIVLAVIVIVLVRTVLVEPRWADIAPVTDIRIDEMAAAKRLSESVTFATVSLNLESAIDAQAFLGMHDFLIRSYPGVHRELSREVISEYSLLYTWQGSEPALPPILLMGHLDVVPADAATTWEWPPFSGAIADGFVWGRGTLDDKVSVLGAMEAVEHLLGQGFQPRRTVYLAFGHDEELDGPRGAGKISQLLAERGVHLAFTFDEGMPIVEGIVPGVSKPVALIGVAEKGYLALKLEVELMGEREAEGACGHTAIPPRNTAIGKLARAIVRLESNLMPAKLEEPMSGFFDFLAPEMDFGMRLVVANLWLFEPLLIDALTASPETDATIRSTTAVSIIRGGVKANVVPCAAEAVADFRILPSDSVAGVIDHVRTVIDDPEVSVTQIDLANEPTPISDVDSWGFETVARTVREIFPDVAVAPGLVLAGTDSKHYVGIADANLRFTPARLGPDDVSRIHGTNERIRIDNYGEIIRFYVQLLRNTEEGLQAEP